MSFTISKIVEEARGQDTTQISKGNSVSLIVDGTLVALGIGTAITSFFVPPVGAVVGPYLVAGGTGIGGVFIADVITGASIAIKKKLSGTLDLTSIRDEIINTPEVVERDETKIDTSRYTPCDRIINGLYLGNGQSFAQTTYFPCLKSIAWSEPEQLNTANPNQFTTIITACPLRAIASDYIDLFEKKVEDYKTSFKEHNITWHYIGKLMDDAPEFWDAFVHDCTELYSQELTEWDGTQSDDLLREICAQKSKALQSLSIIEKFEPLFKVIDAAIQNNVKTLVHCQIGQSRSATILAAYLINRFEVTPTQAINFLKSKRLCVAPKFTAKLDQYATDLQSEKAIQNLKEKKEV